MAKRVLVSTLFGVVKACILLSSSVAAAEPPSTVEEVSRIRAPGQLKAMHDIELHKVNSQDSEVTLSPGQPYGRRIKSLERISQLEQARASQASTTEEQNDYLASAYEAKRSAESFRYKNQNCELTMQVPSNVLKIPAGTQYSVRAIPSSNDGRTAFAIRSGNAVVGTASCLSTTSPMLVQSSFSNMGFQLRLPAYPQNLFVTIGELFSFKRSARNQPVRPDHERLASSILHARKAMGFADAEIDQGLVIESVPESFQKKKVTVTMLHRASGKRVRESYYVTCTRLSYTCSYGEVQYIRRPIPPLPAEPTDSIASAAQ